MTTIFDESKLRVKGQLLKNASLAPYTSWRAGGAAEYLYFPVDLTDLSSLLQQLPENIPLTYLGLGSNTLVRDGGVEGIVIITQSHLNKIECLEKNLIRAEAGVAAAKLARYSARLGMSGLEFMAGIPGTIGGALAMNAGCFGGETWYFVCAVETMDRQGIIRKRTVSDYKIAYREVIGPKDEYYIAGHFALKSGEKQRSLEQIRLLLAKRNATQPTGIANCGSVFRNPAGGDYAGRLIESCGLKGLQVGGAKVSEKHANFILNENQATAADIETLICTVQNSVFEKTGILLKQEVCIIGKK